MFLDIKIEFYFVCFVGALALYSKLMTEDKKVLRFFIHINKKWEENIFINILDVLFFCLIGTFIGTWICQPTNLAQSLSAGLGWTGAMNLSSGKSVIHERNETTHE